MKLKDFLYEDKSQDRYDKMMKKKRDALIGLKNIHGVVVDIVDPEIVSSDSYDSELVFDSGRHGVRWKVNCAKPKAKQSYYQTDDHNLMEPAKFDKKYPSGREED